jgi:hypothetical protein
MGGNSKQVKEPAELRQEGWLPVVFLKRQQSRHDDTPLFSAKLPSGQVGSGVVVVGVGVDVGVAVVLLEVVGVGIVVVALVSGVVEVVSASVVELDEVAAASG